MFTGAAPEQCGLFSWRTAKGKKHRITLLDAIHANTHYITSMNEFDYGAPAEIFACKSRGASPRPVTYRRFASGAEAVRFAIEELPANVLFGTVLETNDHRYDAKQIRNLYDSERYPLQRGAIG